MANEDEKIRCTGQLFGTCTGWMIGWWGTDGHNGRERFYTCNKCGRTN